jgi:hypothetical protein
MRYLGRDPGKMGSKLRISQTPMEMPRRSRVLEKGQISKSLRIWPMPKVMHRAKACRGLVAPKDKGVRPIGQKGAQITLPKWSNR